MCEIARGEKQPLRMLMSQEILAEKSRVLAKQFFQGRRIGVD